MERNYITTIEKDENESNVKKRKDLNKKERNYGVIRHEGIKNLKK